MSTYGSHRMSIRARARRESALLRRESDVATYTAAGPDSPDKKHSLAKAVAEVATLRKRLGIVT